MSSEDDLFWSAHAGVVSAYERALTVVLESLVSPREMAAFVHVMKAEPPSAHLIPAADAHAVDPARLVTALEAFWAAYRNMPTPPGATAYSKYERFPDPYPSFQRGMLDQCYRVWYSRRHTLDEPSRSRLCELICGNPTPPPGMEGFMKRYERVHRADFEREEPELAAIIRKRLAT